MKKNISLSQIFLIIASLGIFVYLTSRAIAVPFTHDESLSYTIITGDNSWKHTANNHLLNTLLMRVTNSLFGSSELSLRLPNIIAFIIFSLALFKLIKSSSNNFILSLLFIVLTMFNPFLLEFFSLARGYGLAIGFIMLSSFFLIRNGLYSSSFKVLLTDFILTSLFASLATYSNLNAVNFLISIIIIFLLKFWLYLKDNSLKKKQYYYFFTILIFSLIPLIENIKWLLFLKRQNQLYYGADSLIESFNSFFYSSLYFKTENYNVASYTLLSILFTLLLFSLFLFIKNIKKNSVFSIPAILLLITFLGIFTENIFFDAKFPYERTSLFYLPILSIFLFTLLSYIHANLKLKLVTILLSLSILLPLTYNFVIGINLTQTKTWDFDKHDKEVLFQVNDMTKFYDKKFTISPNWLCEPSFNYYIQTLNLNLEKVNRSPIDVNCDFIYTVNDSSSIQGFNSLTKFSDINSELLVKANLFD